MKTIFALLLATVLSSCSSTAEQSPDRAAVTAYLRQHLGDPDSYQPVSWQVEPYQQRHASAARGAAVMRDYQADVVYRQRALQRYETALTANFLPADKAAAKRYFEMCSRRNDSLLNLATKLRESVDTTRLGTLLHHVYRAKNKMGGLELDSATFVVADGKAKPFNL